MTETSRLRDTWRRRAASTGGAAALLLCSAGQLGPAQAAPAQATLSVRVTGFEHNRGHVVAKLFRRGDDVPKGPSYRRLSGTISNRRATLRFTNVPYGTYAIFLFHDENDNGIPDHNIIGLPIEPIGFSGGFKVSLFSGIPDFDDLKFEFTQKTGPVSIVVE